MARDLLNKLKAEGSLKECSILVSDDSSLRNTRRVFGRDVTRLNLSRIEFRGGETGHERLAVPMEAVIEIEREGQVLYRKKKRIVKIYPRM